MNNVVQLEFLHVGVGGQGHLIDLKAELKEREETGSPVKTVVRLYDEARYVERFIRKWRAHRLRLHLIKHRLSQTKGWRQLLIKFQYLRLVKRYSSSQEIEERLSFAQIFFDEQIIYQWEDVSIEMEDHHFRSVRDDEVYDLRVSVSRAKGVWMFVFAPNDLCSDTNKLVASAVL